MSSSQDTFEDPELYSNFYAKLNGETLKNAEEPRHDSLSTQLAFQNEEDSPTKRHIVTLPHEDTENLYNFNEQSVDTDHAPVTSACQPQERKEDAASTTNASKQLQEPKHDSSGDDKETLTLDSQRPLKRAYEEISEEEFDKKRDDTCLARKHKKCKTDRARVALDKHTAVDKKKHAL